MLGRGRRARSLIGATLVFGAVGCSTQNPMMDFIQNTYRSMTSQEYASAVARCPNVGTLGPEPLFDSASGLNFYRSRSQCRAVTTGYVGEDIIGCETEVTLAESGVCVLQAEMDMPPYPYIVPQNDFERALSHAKEQIPVYQNMKSASSPKDPIQYLGFDEVSKSRFVAVHGDTFVMVPNLGKD